jgi:prophage DNA circulation protein
MGWRERLQPASFRGISFVVEDNEVSSGRTIVEFAFPTPGENDGATDDQGATPRYHSVTGFVFGDDFDLRAKELEDALRKRGPAELVLPRYGSRLVQVSRYRRRDSWTEGRLARFDFQARETTDAPFPKPVENPNRAAESAAAAANAAATASGSEELQVDGSSSLLDGVEETAGLGLRAMQGVSFIGGIERRVAIYVDKVRTIAATFSELITAPADLAASFIDAISQIGAAGMMPRDALSAYKGLFGLPPNLQGGDTDDATAADKNRQIVVDMIGLGALGGAVVAAAQTDWESTDEALSTRQLLLDQINALSDTTDRDDVFQALLDLRASLVRTVPGNAINAPPALIVTLEQTTNALAVAYRWLDDVDQAIPIAQANRIRNPLFLPGGVPLRIVTRRVG